MFCSPGPSNYPVKTCRCSAGHEGRARKNHPLWFPLQGPPSSFPRSLLSTSKKGEDTHSLEQYPKGFRLALENLGVPSPFFPGILLSTNLQNPREKRLVFEKNDLEVSGSRPLLFFPAKGAMTREPGACKTPGVKLQS